MEGDDKYRALCQLLKERCSSAEFDNDDIKKLVDAGHHQLDKWQISLNWQYFVILASIPKLWHFHTIVIDVSNL